MKLKDLQKISDALHSLGDFAESNSGSDETGIASEMSEMFNEAMKIIDDEKYKNYLRNAIARNKRKAK
tara:strand:- start:13 stop:216 length:204 start_codon:yes stop_codon:yes gene_type:complete